MPFCARALSSPLRQVLPPLHRGGNRSTQLAQVSTFTWQQLGPEPKSVTPKPLGKLCYLQPSCRHQAPPQILIPPVKEEDLTGGNDAGLSQRQQPAQGLAGRVPPESSLSNTCVTLRKASQGSFTFPGEDAGGTARLATGVALSGLHLKPRPNKKENPLTYETSPMRIRHLCRGPTSTNHCESLSLFNSSSGKKGIGRSGSQAPRH